LSGRLNGKSWPITIANARVRKTASSEFAASAIYVERFRKDQRDLKRRRSRSCGTESPWHGALTVSTHGSGSGRWSGLIVARSHVFVLVGVLFAVTACAPLFPSAGITTDTSDFTVEAHADSWRGRPIVAGYIVNKRPLRATRVQLRVEALDAASIRATACILTSRTPPKAPRTA
jgi:hypothetical protein